MKVAREGGREGVSGRDKEDRVADQKLVTLPWTVLFAKSATATFIPVTAWTAGDATTAARAWGEMRAKVNTITIQPAVQYANDVRSPVGTVGIGNSGNSDGMIDPTTATPLTTLSGYRAYRLGWLVTGDGTNIGVCAATAVVQLLST
jgi:hypothetical protein